MKLVLLEDVTHVGRKGETVTVSNGYGINFLIPQRKALKADSPEGLRMAQTASLQTATKEKDENKKLEALRSIIGEQLTLPVEVNESGVLFASLNESKVAEMITALTQVEIDGKNVKLESGAIKEVGEYNATLINGTEKLGMVMLNVEATS